MTQGTFVTFEESRPTEYLGSAQIMNHTNSYFGTTGVAEPGPHAFMDNRGPNHESRAHFHHVDQFQIFYGAEDTTFQRHNTGPLMVHYADADTLYGPFSSGELPFKFMTLRRDGSLRFRGVMPENKADMSHDGSKRHYEKSLGDWIDKVFNSTNEPTSELLFGPHEDGLTARAVEIGPGVKYEGPDSKGSGGQYYVVVRGELDHEGHILSRFTVGWVSASDDAPVFSAGESGARFLVLQFGVQTVHR